MQFYDRLLLLGISLTLATLCYGQSTTPTPVQSGPVTPEQRVAAFAAFLEGQRFLISAEGIQTRATAESLTSRAKIAFQQAVDADPSLAEAYTALAEIAVAKEPNDIDEGIILSRKAVVANRDNFGGHRLLARLLTYKSGLNRFKTDRAIVADAIAEWKEVIRLDSRNAEAWAFLSAMYDSIGEKEENIETLKHWVGSSAPVETQFYKMIMGQAADLSPEAAAVKYGSALISVGRAEEAVTVLANIIAEDPTDQLAIALLEDAVNSAKGTDAKSIATVRQAATAMPGNVILLKVLAKLYQGTGNGLAAVSLLRDASVSVGKLDRGNAANILIALGETYYESGEYVSAVTAFEEALEMRGVPKDGPVGAEDRDFARTAFANLIQAFKQLNRPEMIESTTARARTAFGKDDLFADRQLIAFYRSCDRYGDALLVIRNIRRRNPRDQSFVRLEASVLAEMGDVDKAVETVKNANSNPTTPTAFDELSNLLFISGLYGDSGRGSESVAVARQALAIAGDEDRKQIARLALASAMQTNRQFDDAEQILRSLVKQTPRNPIALNNLGFFLADHDRGLDEAISMINRALSVEPVNPSYLDSLAWAYYKAGRFAEAEGYVKQAARLDPESATIKEHLGDILMKTGKSKEARAAWERALALAVSVVATARLKEKLR